MSKTDHPPIVSKRATDFFDRWPGYTEQSWKERFAELDKRHRETLARIVDNLIAQQGED